MGLIIFLLFLFFILPSLLKRLLFYLAKRQARKMNDAFQRAAGFDPEEARKYEASQQNDARKGGWTAPRQKRKKISSEVGEYVNFQEVDVAHSQSESSKNKEEKRNSSSAGSTPIVEQQIEDANWEEIV